MQFADITKQYQNFETLPQNPATRWAILLSLPTSKPVSELDLVKHVQAGLPAKSMNFVILKNTILDKSDFVSLISYSTIKRAEKSAKKALSPATSERIFELARLWDEALRVFKGDGDAVGRFLRRPNPFLQGALPIEIARTKAGADLVIQILQQADAGVAA